MMVIVIRTLISGLPKKQLLLLPRGENQHRAELWRCSGEALPHRGSQELGQLLSRDVTLEHSSLFRYHTQI